MINPADIVDIVQVSQLIRDDFIKNGKLILDEKGRPQHYTGGYAIVFPFVVNKEKWALRCWYANIGNIERRLKILSAEIQRLKLPYFCNFNYVQNGIIIDGKVRATTRMHWVEGINIKDYICFYKNDKSKLDALANNFLRMCKELHANRIAHGDLQHGNILISNKGSINLIDYDSVYLPALQGEKDIIAGLPAYQHPSRKNNVFANEKLDYFSELVIYISIVAVANQPYLIEKFEVDKSDSLLFKKEDYTDLKASNVYRSIYDMGGVFVKLLDVLSGYLCSSDINDLSPFYAYFLQKSKDQYCMNCGSIFMLNEDRYCVKCGAIRSIYVNRSDWL